MSIRAARWALFLVFVLTVPMPMYFSFDGFIPVIRFLILFAAAGALALAEGAAGPVPGILALLAGHALLGLLASAIAAWIIAFLSRPLSTAQRRGFVLGLCGTLLLVSILFHIYRTPFAHAATANLFGILS